jgi:hypothetical protein
MDKGKTVGQICLRSGKLRLARFIIEKKKGTKRKIQIGKHCHEQSFLHEVLHGIDIVWNGYTLTEEQIENMAEGLYQFIKDNPKVFND